MPASEKSIPVVEEDVHIEKRTVGRGRVRVETVTEIGKEVVRAELETSDVEITRVPVGREVSETPPVRTMGETIVVPVLEEVLVIERRLMLKEELHITRRVISEAVEVPVRLRKQRAVIRRNRDASPETNEDEIMADTHANRSLTAFFDERDDAEEAVSRLRSIGISDSSVRLSGGDAYGETDPNDQKGFWDSVADFFFPEEDRATYSEGLRRGGYLVTVSDIRADQYDQALDILDDEGSVDLDARAETWRSEGWTGSEAGAAAGVGRHYDSGGTLVGSHRGDDWVAGRQDAVPGEEVIPVAEEQLRVGKRDVGLGRVRVRSYVVEEPVSEDVSLREDRVEIERRPVDRPLAGDERAFRDRTIEAEEHTEEAVVSKEARVKEEVALRRERRDRTETVSDTVRHTEIEVEDERDEDLGDEARKRS